MQLLDTTQMHQSNLAAYCRTGKLPAIPGINLENVTHYRRLVYNVVDDMLQNAYPLTFELLTAKEWKNAVNDFFINHSCQSPQVWYMPKEFYEYLSESKHALLKKYPFMEELLWFEWIELEMFMMEDKTVKAESSGDILFSKLVLNPEHKLLSFQYPVHRKNPKFITHSDRGNYFLIAHRNSEGDVIFTDCTPALVRMIEYLAERPLSVSALFSAFQQEYNLTIAEEDQKAIIHFFDNAFFQNLIIGFNN
jgi:hypothetical protein